MNWEEFSSSVGLPAVVGGIAAWLFSVWKDRLNRIEQGRLEDRLKRLELSLSTAGHVQRIQYERELSLYEELWREASRSNELTLAMLYVEDDEPTASATREGVLSLRKCLWQHQPFYAPEVLNSASHVSQRILFLSQVLHRRRTNKIETDIDQLVQELHHATAELDTSIRKRMREISSVPQSSSDLQNAESILAKLWQPLRFQSTDEDERSKRLPE